MLNQLLETIIQILTGWVDKFTSHAQHVEDKLDSLDQTASDIETNTEPISDIADNTGAVITPIQNIKSNTDSIKQGSQTSANNTTAILNNISTLSTNTGRAAAYAQDCANNTLDIKDKVVTIASDTTQIRSNTNTVVTDMSKVYEALKWSLIDKVTTETVEGTDTVSFDTDLANDLVSLEVGIESTQSGTGNPSPDNVRPITGVTNKSITINGNNVTIALGQTVYGGVLDVIRGKLRVTKGYVDLGTMNYNLSPNNIFRCSPPNIATVVEPPYTNRQKGAICSHYSPSSTISISASMNDKSWLRSVNSFLIRDTDYTDVTTFKSAMNGVQLVYELATPIEVQLTPQQIETIKGINTIITNGNISVTFEESVKHYLDKQDN